MWIRIQIIFFFILWSMRFCVKPWRYFQLNSNFFNAEKKIFSKFEINLLIPPKWRLAQQFLSEQSAVSVFPVFLKPEWSQNSTGVTKIFQTEQLQYAKQCLCKSKKHYFLQEASTHHKEFEIFITQCATTDPTPIVMLTEVRSKNSEQLPVHSIKNPNTFYRDKTDALCAAKKEKLRTMLNRIECFKIVRFSVSSDSIEALLNGDFKVIEINLFVPIPISLLDKKMPFLQKTTHTICITKKIAQTIRHIPPNQPIKNIFFAKAYRHYKMKYENNKRPS